MSDSGIGMDAALVERIFEPFFTTKEVGKGTGLGLATVFGIVRQSGGDVRVYSEPGIGTTFSIYLPQVAQPVDTWAPAAAEGEARGGDETILLVDDEDLVRTFEREVLTESGYAVLEATSAAHALELAREHSGPIHLLLTDVVMPGLNGKSLAERIEEDRPEIVTLYTSGYTADAIVRHGVLEPGVSFLPKPLTRATLIGKVRELLDAARR
jgi:CheY-like chemotaxis protein